MKYVIGDIHGCLESLRALLEQQIQPTIEDEVIFVGDYINKGPSSAEVLDYLIEFQSNFPNTTFLKGNHEDSLIRRYKQKSAEEFKDYVIQRQGNLRLLGDDGRILPRYMDFMTGLSYYWEDEQNLVSHAGFNLDVDSPLEDIESMLTIRDFDPNNEGLNGKRIIHGHDPTDLNVIKTAVEAKSKCIPIDNGCVYKESKNGYENSTYAHLCALSLEPLQLYVQPNID